MDENGNLKFNPTPAIPEYLIADENGRYYVESTLLGTTKYTLEFDKKQDYIPGDYRITEIKVEYLDGSLITIEGDTLPCQDAEKIRDRCAKSVTIKMTPK